MTDQPLIDLKREFVVNQTDDLACDLEAFIAAHPIFRDLPEPDKQIAARSAAISLLLAIRVRSIVELVR